MPRFVDDCREAELFVQGTLDSLVSEDSVARMIWHALERLDFSEFEARYNNDKRGRRAVEPQRLAAVWMLGLMHGHTAATALARLCCTSIEYRWLLGGASVRKSSLSSFRRDYVKELTNLSTQVLTALAQAGMLPGKHLCVDGTVIRAAASCGANCSRKHLKGRIQRLSESIEKALERPEENEAELNRLYGRKLSLDEALEKMDALGLTDDKARITVTEHDAPKRKLKSGAFAPAHNIQVTADMDSSAIIGLSVVDQGGDAGLLEPEIGQAQLELKRVAEAMKASEHAPGPIASATADAAYHDTHQLRRFEDNQIEAFVPDDRCSRRPTDVADAFLADKFTYDLDTDTMHCPLGHPMKYRKLNNKKTAATYQADAAHCNACPHKSSCCPKAKHGRSVNRPLYPEVLERTRERVGSERGGIFKKGRWITAEGVIGRLVERLDWRRCRLRGSRGAFIEGIWRQLTHNLMLMEGQWKPIVLHEQLA